MRAVVLFGLVVAVVVGPLPSQQGSAGQAPDGKLGADPVGTDAVGAAREPVALFDGRTLDGWTKRGGKATYEVVDGTIVGTTVPRTGNTFLCTERDYGDFELELELKVDPRLNSGIQIRSAVRPDGRVYGYQVEIDPSKRAQSGGIYDEARRGWIGWLPEDCPARRAFDSEGWNHYRVRCVGDSIRTWVNGEPAADIRDPLSQSGFIALQVHGVGGLEEPLAVAWRNIRIRDLGAHRWRSILDLSSADSWRADWRAAGGGQWRVRDGVLVGTNEQSERRHGVLLSRGAHRDFTAKIVYRAVAGNSGFYFRSEPVDGPMVVHGFQAEIDPKRDAGMLYETGGRARVQTPKAKLVERAFRPGKWNEMVVSAHGRRVVVTLNGHRMSELVDDPGRISGHFGIQLHGGQDMAIEVRDVALLEPANRRGVLR